ncbi:MAG: SMP-30/gluconolactonase/LRE family protein [Chloroflexota bacterium]|nr:SMP-30/gluconolactonase/LRE family protein [Chloroflexota bacterium]
MSDVEHILPVQNVLGEGPLWSTEEQALYWVDIESGTYSRFSPATGAYAVVNVGVPIGVMALRASGGLIMATRDGFAFWEAQTQELRYIAKPEEGKPYMRFNDGAVDCAGRFWAGSMNQDEQAPADGTLYRLDPDGSVYAMFTPVAVSNGIGWSPDNTIMYFTDSPLRTIFAFDFDAATGELANRRAFVHTPDDRAVPDGLTVDSEGCIWSAYWGGARIVRYDPTGKVNRTIQVPAVYVTSCVFGGPHLDELYITSASRQLSEKQKQRYPLSGDLFRVKTGIRGLEKFKFGG